MATVIGVRFKKAGKVYYFDPNGLWPKPGENVVVETARGVEYGEAVTSLRTVDDAQVVQPLKKVVRIATEEDTRRAEQNAQHEIEAFKKYAETYPDAVKAFLTEYEASTTYINENVADGAQLVEKYGIVKAAVAEKAIPYCNITYIAGEDMVAPMNGYLQVLFDQNPKSIGGAMPGADFYCIP